MKKKILISIISFLVLSLIGFWIWFPSEAQIKGCLTTSMYGVELCSKSKNYVPLSQISKNVQNSIILTEDSGFYQHNGFDEDGIEHCFKKLKEKMHIVCGGSTITQQLAKNMFLFANKNFVRKGLEALITIKIEKTLTKKEILEKYLNIVQFGKNIFGVKMAAQFYFKKSPAQLDATEAAFLAMVLPNPEKYSQSYFRKDLTKFARSRVTQIVNNMRKFGRIDEGAYSTAMGNVDYFLGAPKPPPEKQHEEELTSDDLSEMVDQINDEPQPEIKSDKNTELQID